MRTKLSGHRVTHGHRQGHARLYLSQRCLGTGGAGSRFHADVPWPYASRSLLNGRRKLVQGLALAGSAPEEAEAPAVPEESAADSVYSLNWPTNLHERFTLGPQIGRGSFGTVREAVERWPVQTFESFPKRFAVKTIPKLPKRRKRQSVTIADPAKAAQRQKDKLLQEVAFMVALSDCPFAAQLVGAYEDEHYAHLVVELCSGGDLKGFLEERGHLSEREAADVLFTTLNFIKHCHSKNFVFCDVKPANFMLKFKVPSEAELGDSKGDVPLVVKGIDFGCSQRLQDNTILIKRTGTPAYWSPEVFMRYYDYSADLWSCGMMMYELLVGKLPFWEEIELCTPRDVQKGVLYGNIDTDNELYKGLSKEAKNLILRLLDRDPDCRITADEALKHPWLLQHHTV